jgi:DNA-binding phage protein
MDMTDSVFWADLANDLQDPTFLREYLAESVRIASIDAIINTLNDARVTAGLSKAELARAIGAEPATIRRLLSASMSNPTLGTLAEVAAALGLRISVEPLSDIDQEAVTIPLRTGQPAATTAHRAVSMRGSRRKTAAAKPGATTV